MAEFDEFVVGIKELLKNDKDLNDQYKRIMENQKKDIVRLLIPIKGTFRDSPGNRLPAIPPIHANSSPSRTKYNKGAKFQEAAITSEESKAMRVSPLKMSNKALSVPKISHHDTPEAKDSPVGMLTFADIYAGSSRKVRSFL